MASQGVKGMIGCIFIASIMFLGSAEASRRVFNSQEKMENLLIRHREVELFDRVFDIYINFDEQTITVQGTVEDLKEREKVEEHFELRSPKNFRLIYQIDLLTDF